MGKFNFVSPPLTNLEKSFNFFLIVQMLTQPILLPIEKSDLIVLCRLRNR